MGYFNTDHCEVINKIWFPHFRWMIRRDLYDVNEIESLSEGGRWSENRILEFLRGRCNIGQVVEVSNRVVGHCLYTLHKNSIDLVRIVVHPNHRGQGVGTLMVDKLISKLTSHQRNRLVGWVPLDPPVCRWFARRGFESFWNPTDEQVRFVLRVQEEEVVRCV